MSCLVSIVLVVSFLWYTEQYSLKESQPSLQFDSPIGLSAVHSNFEWNLLE